MAKFYSDNLASAANQLVVDVAYDANYRRDSKQTHAVLRKKRMLAANGAAYTPIGSVLIMGTFKSSDRIYDIRGTIDIDSGATGDIDLGLFKSGLDHSGSEDLGPDSDVASHDIFADAEDINAAALSRVDWLTHASVILNVHRGLRLWEMVNVQDAATYTVDPQENWDLVITFPEVTTDILLQILIEVDYVG